MIIINLSLKTFRFKSVFGFPNAYVRECVPASQRKLTKKVKKNIYQDSYRLWSKQVIYKTVMDFLLFEAVFISQQFNEVLKPHVCKSRPLLWILLIYTKKNLKKENEKGSDYQFKNLQDSRHIGMDFIHNKRVLKITLRRF